MPLAFSFFTSKRPTEPAQASLGAEVTALVQEAKLEESPPNGHLHSKSPFPIRSAVSQPEPPLLESMPSADWQSADTLILPKVDVSEPKSYVALPEKRENLKGLAALVVDQSAQEAPPLNRRRPPTFPISPVAGQCDSNHDSLPDQSGLHSLDHSTSSESNNLRDEIHHEIEQVKNDLFGAVMGVSALKDRLDGLESQIGQIQSVPKIEPASSVARAEMEEWLSAWLEEHLPAAVERALANAQERALGIMSTTAYFRTTTQLSDTDRQSFLNHPPVILTSTPV